MEISKTVDHFFHLADNGTTVCRELRGGAVTFMTMCYIIFVQRAVLGSEPPMGAGMDPQAVVVVTCLVAAIGTLIMGLAANYPIALAPCMGENFYFVTVAGMTVGGVLVGWQTALAAVFFSGLIFLFLSTFRFREAVFESIPDSLKYAISAGIGIFIALIGMQRAGIITVNKFTGISLGNLHDPQIILAIFGLLITSILFVWRVRGAFMWGILITSAAGLIMTSVFNAAGMNITLIQYKGLVAAPPSIAPIFGKIDIRGLLNLAMIPIIIVFLIMVLFDTVGTLVGVGTQAGLLRDGKLPRIGKALIADATATTAGAFMGSSTVSSYIESAAGVADGARTGLANMMTAFLFLLAIFFTPLVEMIGGGAGKGGLFLPAVAPVMILVGSLMMKSITRIDWSDPTDGIPAFLVIIGIPFSYNIAYGIGFGFVIHPLVKLVSGRGNEVRWLCYTLGAVFLIYFAFLLH
jgi:AGZA family xanthine/uracil permease-like MFS transporter